MLDCDWSSDVCSSDLAITQFFFNADAYFHFMDRLAKAGVKVPVIPGIMPITNASNLIRFSDSCGADIPRWLRKQLIAFGDDSASIKALGEEVVATLIEKLIQGGAPAFHFYTMNQSEATTRLVKLTGLA
jgi:methylenetetrahydrofolate reductase (NADPH)